MKRYFLVAILLLTTLFSCQDPQGGTEPEPNPDAVPMAIVLNEGMWSKNDAELSVLYTDGTLRNNYFAMANGRGLGDVAQDALMIDGRLYVSVWSSNTLEVVDPRSGKSLKQFILTGKGPRYMATDGRFVYLSCYSKQVLKIDPQSLTVVDSCSLSGMQPEGLAVADGKLFVTSTWQYRSDGSMEYDNQVSVVDLASFEESHKIQVPLNPQRIRTADNGQLVLQTNGNYGSDQGGLVRIDPISETVTSLTSEVSNFDIVGNICYYYFYSYSTQQTGFFKLDITNGARTPLFENTAANIVTPYGISVDPRTGNIYITDSQNYRMNGDLHCFAPDGTYLWTSETTTGPSKVVFL